MSKNPVVAVLVNLACPGFGYVYARRRIWFGVMLSAANVAQFISVQTDELPFKWTPFMLVGLGLYYLATTMDVLTQVHLPEGAKVWAQGDVEDKSEDAKGKEEDNDVAKS